MLIFFIFEVNPKSVLSNFYGSLYLISWLFSIPDARGLLTGSVTELSDGGTDQLYSVLYYDSRSRLIQR